MYIKNILCPKRSAEEPKKIFQGKTKRKYGLHVIHTWITLKCFFLCSFFCEILGTLKGHSCCVYKCRIDSQNNVVRISFKQLYNWPIVKAITTNATNLWSTKMYSVFIPNNLCFECFCHDIIMLKMKSLHLRFVNGIFSLKLIEKKNNTGFRRKYSIWSDEKKRLEQVPCFKSADLFSSQLPGYFFM